MKKGSNLKIAGLSRIWDFYKRRKPLERIAICFLVGTASFAVVGMLCRPFASADAQPVAPSYSQDCQPGAGCSQGQTGGITTGTYIDNGPPKRQLSPEQFEKIRSALAASAVTGKIEVRTATTGCSDCEHLANQIETLIGSVPGWTAVPNRPFLIVPTVRGPFHGVFFGVDDPKNQPPIAVAILSAFNAGGVKFPVLAMGHDKGTDAVIWILSAGED